MISSGRYPRKGKHMIQKLALTLLTLTLLLQIVHAQTPSQKLESIFSDYELVQLDPEAINRMA